jgi:acyl-CoA thioesterase-1
MRSFSPSRPGGQVAHAARWFTSYGRRAGSVQVLARRIVSAVAVVAVLLAGHAVGAGTESARPLRIVALGDSLVAGYGLRATEAFPAKLQQALAAKGFAVEIVNAGISGNTAADGLGRLDWSVPEGTDAVILELGANDALRGVDPAATRKALDTILGRLKERHIPVLLCGMAAPRNMGTAYAQAFDAIFPALAAAYNVPFYPFFLDGVATDLALNQRDGLHPSAAGVDVIVKRILPKMEELIAQAKLPRGS